jgi:hypothetical protein
MSSKPKKSEYQASDAEKASASVAMAEYEYFKQKYDPLLQKMRDKSLTEDVQSGLRGRANADTMQALSRPTMQTATSSSAAGDMSAALTGQLGVANNAAKQVQNQMQTNVLGTARGQAADAQTGMAQASRLATSEALERARANQQVAQSKMSALAQVGSTLVFQGLDNKGTRGVDADGNEVKGTFFKPVDSKGNRVSGFGNRLAYSEFFGGR